MNMDSQWSKKEACFARATQVWLAVSHIRGEFNDASALERSFYWCQALHITNKDRYQSTSARRALALLNSPLANEFDVRGELHGQVSLAAVNQILCNS